MGAGTPAVERVRLLTANDLPGSYPPSWYAATAQPFARQPRLEGERDADICVIGGGFTGLSAALHLAERGFSVRLLEAHRVGFGASGRNGGQVGSGQRVEQDQLEAQHGSATAHALWDLSMDAKALVTGLIDRFDIKCDYHSGVAAACWRDREVKDAHRYADKLRRDYGYEQIKPLDRAGMASLIGSPQYRGGVLDHGAGHLHPLNYALGLAKAALGAGAVIHENTTVIRIEDGKRPAIHTEHGRLRANLVILACNGYLDHLHPQIGSRVMPINNFIIATEPLGERATEVLTRNIAVADSKFVVNYFRLTPDERLLFGGGETSGYRFPDDIGGMVRKSMLSVFPHLADVAIDYAWGGTLAITMSRMPYFVRLSPTMLSASGYSGHGVAMATLAGRLLAETAAGQASGFDVMAKLDTKAFPGGARLRTPLLMAAMLWYSLRDRLP